MVTTKNGTGIVKIASISLAVLLLAGVAGSLVMGARARSAALENAVTQAKAIADGSLSLVFRPDDVDGVAADARADMLSDQIGSVVIDPSDFDTVTLWSPTAEILYATEEGRIGNQLDGERDRIREALRGAPQTRVSDGTVSGDAAAALRVRRRRAGDRGADDLRRSGRSGGCPVEDDGVVQSVSCSSSRSALVVWIAADAPTRPIFPASTSRA